MVKQFIKSVAMEQLQEFGQERKRRRDEQKLEPDKKIRALAAGVERKGKPTYDI